MMFTSKVTRALRTKKIRNLIATNKNNDRGDNDNDIAQW